MSSHIRYRGFQGDIRQLTAPISFDAAGMETLLTLPEIAPWHQSGGLIVSDALGVPAVRKHFDPNLESFPHRRIAKEAFLAGNHILSLVQFDLKSIWSDQFANIKDTIFFFRTEYNRNPAFAARVDEAVARILRTKLELYPELNLDTLNTDPDQAVQLTRQTLAPVNDIARQSLTLLYPSPDELRLRIPQPPRPDETILVVVDSRLARECYIDNCQPQELYLSRMSIEEMILRMYGPNATGQIQPDQISSITFSELKLALGGTIAPPPESAESAEENPLVRLSAEDVRRRIQEADWLIIASLDLSTSRYSDSDALRLFLAQESGTLLDKTTVVLAFNAPYYLDTTEVTKLTAYYGVYSKTTPHIEAAVRAIFGEADLPGASPVSVEGIGYELVDVLAPDPAQDLLLELVNVAPESGEPPVSVQVRVGPVIDHNGNLVPDGTPVEVRAMQGNQLITSEIVSTVAGLAGTALTLTDPGEIQISAIAGQAVNAADIPILVAAPPTATTAATALPPVSTVTGTPTTIPDTPTPTTTPTATPIAPIPESDPSPPLETPPGEPRPLDGVDLLLALGAALLAGLLGFWLGHQFHKPLSRRVRVALWTLIGGLLAYLLYGLGWLRPEQWLVEEPGLPASRLAIVGLAFVFSLAAVGLSSRSERQL
jgi:beta-N-acetylhexosaminidase